LRTTINNAATMHKQADGSPETAPPEEAIERLVDKVDAAGLEPEDLDEIVHEFAASIATDVNNGGLEDQIRYLVDGMGAQQTEQQLDELIEGQPKEGE
jgi:Tfp pilus assembly PilM family ATPase